MLIANRDNINGRRFPRVVRRGDIHGRGECVTMGYNTVPRNAVSSRLFNRIGNTFANTVRRQGNCFTRTANNAVFLSRVNRLPLSARTHLLHMLRSNRFVGINSSGIRGAGMHVITTAGMGVISTVTAKGFHRRLCCHLGAVPVAMPTLHRHPTSVSLLFHGFTTSMTRHCAVPPLRLARNTGHLLTMCP